MKVLSTFIVFAVLTVTWATAYTVDIGVSDIEANEVELGTLGSFDVLKIENEVTLPVEPGYPALPGYSVSIAIPYGTVIEDVEVSYSEPETLDGTFNIMPSQKPLPIGTAPEYTKKNKDVYASTAPFPGELVHSFTSGNRSGYHVGNLLFAPVQYIPATGEILVYTDISFDVSLTSMNGEAVYPKVRLRWMDDRIRGNFASSVINPGEIIAPPGMKIIDGYNGLKDDVFPYLIISGSNSTANLDPLVEWKTRKGNKAKIVTVSDIESNYTGTDTAEKIRNCIIDYYANNGTQYVLLVGTNNSVPMRYCHDSGFNVMEGNGLVPTDNYYGCLDGDWNDDGDSRWGEHPGDQVDYEYDIYVGRLQTQNTTYVADIVDKILCYEGSSLSSLTNPYDYYDETLLAGAWLDSSTNTGETMEYIRDNYLTDSFWTNEVLQDNSYSGSTFSSSRFRSEMSEGRNLISHSAHSNHTLLGTNSGDVYSSHLEALNNSPRFTGSLYSLGCYQGHIETSNNCAATFVRNDGGGGVGYVGNTRYGWYGPGDPHAWSAMFLEEYFKRIGVNDEIDSGEAYNQHKHTYSNLMSDDYYRYIYYELYITGDPDICFNNGTISAPTVTYDAETPQGNHVYNVNVSGATKAGVNEAMVCLWKDDEVYDSKLTDGNGDVAFIINPQTEGTMYLTVTAANCQPFEADVTVTDELVGISLAYFDGKQIKEGVEIRWGTSDYKPYGFDLYKRLKSESTEIRDTKVNSLESKTDKIADSWSKLNALPIEGTTSYSYLDTGVSEGDYEYKLELLTDTEPETMGTLSISVITPKSYALHQSRPNPAYGEAVISFSLASSAHTTLEVYDITGRKVRTLVDEILSTGNYDRTVSGISSGIYIYRLASGDFSATKKMVIK